MTSNTIEMTVLMDLFCSVVQPSGRNTPPRLPDKITGLVQRSVFLLLGIELSNTLLEHAKEVPKQRDAVNLKQLRDVNLCLSLLYRSDLYNGQIVGRRQEPACINIDFPLPPP